MPKYMEQFERAERYYERFRKINDGVIVSSADTEQYMPSSLDYEDDVRSFFVHCYHVKDWIINGPEVCEADRKRLKTKVEDFIEKKDSLKLCNDICQGVKHLYRNRPSRSGDQPEFAGSDTRICLGGSIQKLDTKYWVQWKNKKLDTFELATSAMNAWRSFIHEM